MKVELSEQARKTVESFIEDGTFPSPEAVVEAAIEQLEFSYRDLTPEEIEALVAPAYEDVAAGRTHPAEEVLAEARALINAKIAKSRSA